MRSVDYEAAMLARKKIETTRKHQLTRFARRWDKSIRRQLRQFAQKLWPDIHVLGLVSLHDFRLRRQTGRRAVIWWVERDIPPSDRYRCEAYRVVLSLTPSCRPQLTVRTGVSDYPVIPLNIETLKVTLDRAAADIPLVIHRQFGPALDP